MLERILRKQSLLVKSSHRGRFTCDSWDQLESRTQCCRAKKKKKGKKEIAIQRAGFSGGGRLQKVAPLVIFYTTERSTTHCSAMMINKYTLHSSGKEGYGAAFESEDDDDDGGDDGDGEGLVRMMMVKTNST